MKVDENVVAIIAELAQLEIPAEHMQEYVDSLCNVLNLVDEMQSVNTEGVEPMSNPLDGVQTLRPDLVTESDQRDYYQKNAPDIEDGLYLVPRVVE